jgi:hypothetical protein
LMNNPLLVKQAKYLAERARKAGSLPEMIATLYRLTLQREPTAAELRTLSEHAGAYGLPNVSRLLLNSNEFLFVD